MYSMGVCYEYSFIYVFASTFVVSSCVFEYITRLAEGTGWVGSVVSERNLCSDRHSQYQDETCSYYTDSYIYLSLIHI